MTTITTDRPEVPGPSAGKRVDTSIIDRVRAAGVRFDEWEAAPDLTPREREMLSVMDQLGVDAGKAYAFAWHLAPPYTPDDGEAGVAATYATYPRAADGKVEFLLAKMPGLERHTFNGLDYEIMLGCDDDGNGLGWCSPHDDPDGLMLWIHKDVGGVRLVEVATHEALHACLGTRMGEAEVDRIAKDVSAFVLKLTLARLPGARHAMGLGDTAV